MAKKIKEETPQSYADRIYHALEEAKELIHLWHNMGMDANYANRAWALYQKSPEMKRINETLAEFK